MNRFHYVAAIAAAVAVAGRPASAEPPATRALSFAETIAIASKDAPDLAVATKSIDAAEASLTATRRLRLPKLTVDANVMFWNEALEFEFSIPGMMPPPGTETEPFVVRERVTSTVSANLALPLSSQLVLNHYIGAEQAGLTAARHDLSATRNELAHRAAESYLRLLQARAARDIADATVTLLTAQLDRARVLQEAGLLERVDVMRLEAAVSAGKLRTLEAEKLASLVEAGLALLLGLPDGTSIAVVDGFPRDPGPPAEPKPQPEARPDVMAARARVEQAKQGAKVSYSDMFPNVVAVTSLQHNEGADTFQPKNAWFAGVTLSWDVWDWGSDWETYKAAKHRAEQAKMATDRLADRATLEVQNAALEARTAHEAIAAARAGLSAAEEASRIQNARFSEGKGTTTDLLDAQTEVTRARLAESSARFSYFVALAALAHAEGRMPDSYLSGI